MNILSIQSHVAYGHVGNSTAVFALQRMGHEVWPIHTVHYSNHPGHGRFRGRVAGADELAEIVEGLDDLEKLAGCDAVLSGYLGDAETGRAMLDAVARVKARNPSALYLCDPVMGDSETGLYVDPALVSLLRDEAIPAADIVTPNAFELATLTATANIDSDRAKAVAKLRKSGPRWVIVSGIGSNDGKEMTTLGAAATGGVAVTTPRLETEARPDGAGDLFAAVFLGKFLEWRDFSHALAHAASATFAVLEASAQAATDEMRLISAQNDLLAPKRRFQCKEIDYSDRPAR